MDYWPMCCCFYQVNFESQSQRIRLCRYDNSGITHFGKLWDQAVENVSEDIQNLIKMQYTYFVFIIIVTYISFELLDTNQAYA